MTDIEQRVVKAIEAVRAQGIAVAPGEWGVRAMSQQPGSGFEPILPGSPCCCPLGAVLIAEACPFVPRRPDHGIFDRVVPAHEDPEVSAAHALGVSVAWVRSFINGVDGHGQLNAAEEGAWLLGRRLRDREYQAERWTAAYPPSGPPASAAFKISALGGGDE